MTIVTPEPTITRDRFGRPLVVSPTGGRAVPYTRATTFVDCIDDKFNLQKWMLRMTVLGIASRPDLLLAVSAHKDNKAELDRICEAAKEAAAASAAATTGTALHALTELVDRGQELPVLPGDALADLEAYRTATAELKAVHIERFTVQDKYCIGGTPDRIVQYQGKRYIADIKTGSIEWGTLKIAAQLAVYARSHLYDIATAERSPHGADLERGIILHLPAGQARCDLIWVDLMAGWRAVHVAKQVREQRALKYTDLTRPWADTDGFKPTVERTDTTPLQAISYGAGKARRMDACALAVCITACSTYDEVVALWTTHQAAWNDRLTEVARNHIATLAKTPAVV